LGYGAERPKRIQSNLTREGQSVMTRIPLNIIAGQAQDLRERLDMSTAEIGLSVRTTNCLEEKGIFTVNDLLHSTREDLLSISNFGEKTLEEVYQALEQIGFYRKTKREAVMA
jgi:DNA-directed RNA polymerase subunit alpha